jgi:hypothetical protein
MTRLRWLLRISVLRQRRRALACAEYLRGCSLWRSGDNHHWVDLYRRGQRRGWEPDHHPSLRSELALTKEGTGSGRRKAGGDGHGADPAAQLPQLRLGGRSLPIPSLPSSACYCLVKDNAKIVNKARGTLAAE